MRGMSMPVVSRSTVTAIRGLGSLRKRRMSSSGRSTLPVILATSSSGREASFARRA